MGWTDRDGSPVDVPDPPADAAHYAQIGAFQGSGYGRNAFAKGTGQEASVLFDVLGLQRGQLLVDVGCGNGRHVAALRDRGVRAFGVDLSPEVLAGGCDGLACARAEAMPFADESVDAVISVCQGGFGVTPSSDSRVLGEAYRVLRPGGRLALTAFSLVFAARWMGEGDALNLGRGLHHHTADVRGPDGQRRNFDLWTVAYTPAHLQLLLDVAGFRVLGVAGVEAGAYRADRAPTVADPEVLIWATRV